MKPLRIYQIIPEAPGFRRNLFTLISGTTLSQILGLAFLPVLTRLYEPEAFGLFGIFYALVCVLGILATWRLDMAVMLPSDESHARRLWKAVFLLLSANSSIITACLFVFLWIYPTQQQPWQETWVTLSVGLFLIASAEALMQWHTRMQNYKILAAKNVLERVAVTGFAVLFAFWGLHRSGLIWAQVGALLVFVGYMLWASFPLSPIKEKVTIPEVKKLLSSYKDFPLMQGWSMLFLIGSTQLPNLLFGSAFTMEDTGHVNLAYRILEAPVNLFAVSFATAFYQHISQKKASEINDLFRRSTGTIFKWIFPVFLIGGVASPFLFPVIFGGDWSAAGWMAAPLALMMFFKIIYLSHNVIFLVLRRLDLDLKVSGSIVLAQICGFYVTRIWTDSPAHIVTAMSLLSTVAFMFGIYLIRREIRRSAKLESL